MKILIEFNDSQLEEFFGTKEFKLIVKEIENIFYYDEITATSYTEVE